MWSPCWKAGGLGGALGGNGSREKSEWRYDASLSTDLTIFSQNGQGRNGIPHDKLD